MSLQVVLNRLGLAEETVTPFRSAEDGAAYPVWKVGDSLVLKKAKGREAAIYDGFFRDGAAGVPRLIRSIRAGEESYLLMEFVPGEDLCHCDREKLRKALDALISLQGQFWEARDLDAVGIPFADALDGRRKRGQYLNDGELEAAYGRFLDLFEILPRTLCHDDLLPFNVLAGEREAVLLDWEVAGILPYPTSLARLIAHGSEAADAFFCLTESDREFAVEYYYEALVKEKGISRAAYYRDLEACLLYEYCEWIMLGNRYPEVDRARFHFYQEKAKALIRKQK